MTELDLSLGGADGWRTGRRSFLAQAGGAVGGAIGTGALLGDAHAHSTGTPTRRAPDGATGSLPRQERASGRTVHAWR